MVLRRDGGAAEGAGGSASTCASWGLLVLIYMFVPIFVVVLMSFNDPVEPRNVYSFDGFTLDNWTNFCGPLRGCAMLPRSASRFALLATTVATHPGTLAAFA